RRRAAPWQAWRGGPPTSLLRELLERRRGLLADRRLGVDGDCLLVRAARLGVRLRGLRGVALLLGDAPPVRREVAEVELSGLERGVRGEHGGDLRDGRVDVAAVEERRGVVGAHVGVGGPLLPGGRVGDGRRLEVAGPLLELFAAEGGDAL